MAQITATSRDVGGIIGWGQRSTIDRSFNYGDITATLVVGGIIGYANNNMTISNVYNRGGIQSTITSGSAWIGGIIGASYTNTTLHNSYSAGSITSRRNDRIGGIIGGVSGITHESNSYYDQTIIEAQTLASGYFKPTQAIFNKLNQADVRGLDKTSLIGTNALVTTNLSTEDFVFVLSSGAEAFYPQLKVFESHLSDYVQADSLTSVSSYVFVGEGSVDAPYIIVNAFDMENLSKLVELGITFEDKHFRVKSDVVEINLTYGINYKPIGNDAFNFEGTFDGSGTTFVVNITSLANDQALFGVLGRFGIVKNLAVKGSVTGHDNVASIVARNYGEVTNVYTMASVTGHENVGLITGYNDGLIDNTYAIGSVIGDTYVGGLVGYNSHQVTSSYSSSDVFGKDHVGGVIGYSAGIVGYLYYNTSRIEVSINDDSSYEKPFRSISNVDSTADVLGILSNELYSGFTALSLNDWTFETSTGFYAYYPQLKVFSSSTYTAIKEHSKHSVTVNKFNEGDGSKDDPYIIRNAYDMEALSQMITAKYTL